MSDPRVTTDLLMRPGGIMMMGIPPNRIDLLNQIDGVEFDPCFDRRLAAEVDGLTIPVIGREDLLANKLASGRPKDLADVDNLTG